jgi:ribosomal protein S18 acetylase RimI-like enzyme
MQSLSRRLWSRSSFFHPGGIAWGFASATEEAPLRIWRTSGEVVAWAFVGGGQLCTQIDPVHSELTDEVVAWGLSAGALSAMAPAGKDRLNDALVANGFTRADGDPFQVDMRRSTEEPPAIELQNGYTVRSITDRDLAERVAVHCAAWAPSNFNEARYRRVRTAPLYREDLDIVAVAPDGTFRSCCIAWVDEDTASAEIEPVGTHAEYRRLGLASAVCAFAVARLAELGVSEVTIQPRGDDAYPVPRIVYGSIGFEVVNRTFAYLR